ncbi:MAG: PHP domain-containing protein [Victivallaceae bacterium]|nr:PHP domain-containing protein [Victivallaceae bacterium]
MNLSFDNHIHTIYSGHSDPMMTVGNIIKYSEQAQLTQIAITEHSFDWHLGPRGNLELIQKELAAVETDIRVLVGMEIDPDMKNWGRLNFEDFNKDELFPVLVGFHGYPGMDKGWFEKVHFTRRDKNRIYNRWSNMLEKLIENPKVDVLAHPGRLIMQNRIIDEFSGNILRNFERFAAAARQYDVAFEINETLLNSIPTEKLWKSYRNVLEVMLANGVKLSVGSDAHSPDKIGRFNRVLEFIQPFNINSFDFLTINQGEQNETQIHTHRIARCDRDHSDTRQYAAAGAE